MVTIRLDSVEFRLKEYHDFSWLKRYGKAFWCVDETGSGCICIGMEKEGERCFCKIAGVGTIEADVGPEESVDILKSAVSLYRELEHGNLVKVEEEYGYGSFYVVVFQWITGECLFDHWNFDKYKQDSTLKSPRERFRELPVGQRLKAADVLFSFLEQVNRKGYVAVDFYDGSLMYDFEAGEMTICDIDLFRKAPAVNDRGADWYGTKRLKAPEEYVEGAVIDERTNIFTLGALLFEFFGEFTADEVKERYRSNRFVPCPYDKWELDEKRYEAAVRAVSLKRSQRYRTFGEFWEEWRAI